MTLSASIVAFEQPAAQLLQAVHSFLATPIALKELYIIDHSPTDTLRTVLAALPLHYAHHPENRGYGAGHNIAMRQTLHKSAYHLVLNPDVSFAPDTLPRMLRYMQEQAAVAALMPRIVDDGGALQYLAKLLPTPLDLLRKRFAPSATREHRFQLRFTGYDAPMNVPYLSGCFMLLRCSALAELGLFDERFFMYPEDIDLSRRLHRHYRTEFFPYATITHGHAAASYQSRRMLWIHMVNMAKYFNKWGWFFDKERKKTNLRVLKELGYQA